MFPTNFSSNGKLSEKRILSPACDDQNDIASGETPWDDLTDRVQTTAADSSPFDDDPTSEALFDRLARALHRAAPRHVVMVRERGVGELAVLIEFARRAASGRPSFLCQGRVVLFDCRLVRCDQSVAVLSHLLADPAADEQMMLCLDGFAALLRSPDQTNHRAAIIELLAAARCRVIGIMTPQEYEEYVAVDLEYQALFEAVPVEEPGLPLATKLVQRYADGLVRQYGVRIDDDAVQTAVNLSAGLMLHDRLPSKAVKALRAICDDIAYDRAEKGVNRDRITSYDVTEQIARTSGVPASTLSGVGDQIDYAKHLGDIVFGQPHAVAEVANELGLIKAGMVDQGKPASVIMLIGQTGTGKTELAKALARLYSPTKRLKTFTLGNFAEPHSVSGLIGVPAGYVGHDQGGRLVNELNADPYSVFLLDEADKAHPDVMQPFLNLFDEGWLYDQRGVKAYAGHAIFVLTTNIGQRQIAELCKQGKGTDEITATMKEALSKIRHTKSNRAVFTPEFLARIKRFIVFRSLDAGAMRGICGKLIHELAAEWIGKRHKRLVVSDKLINAIAEEAHQVDERSQGREGGRIARKIIADWIESKIQFELARDTERYRAASTVEIDYEADPDGTTGPAPTDVRRVVVRFSNDAARPAGHAQAQSVVPQTL